MKVVLYLLLLTLLFCVCCANPRKIDDHILCKDWEAIYETSSTYHDGELVKKDSSRYCCFFGVSQFIRLFRDSTFVVYDTIHRKNDVFNAPRESGRFELHDDSLYIYGRKYLVVKLTDDTLILQWEGGFNNNTTTIKTILVNTKRNYNPYKFNFPKNKIDTMTNIGKHSIITLNGKHLDFIRYDRTFLCCQDTILHLVKDVPSIYRANTDSILENLDSYFNAYYMGDYRNQLGVSGHIYDTIHCAVNNLITYYFESYDYSRVYLGASHGDWAHAYETFVPHENGIRYHDIFMRESQGEKVRFNDIFKKGTKNDVNELIAEAIISNKIKSGWIDKNQWDNKDEFDAMIIGKKSLYMRLNYDNRVALGKGGIIISVSYGDAGTDICFAENYICALVPYRKLKPYLKPPFNKLAR